MLKRKMSHQSELEFVSIETLVPQNHLLRKIDRHIDFAFIYDKVEHLYCKDNGAVVESYEYDAYGNTTIFDASGAVLNESMVGNRYTFQGREMDWTTGLMYFRARWYDSETGRWLSKDPIGISGGLNLYAFCGNNPVNFVDPFGLCGTRTMAQIYADRLANLTSGLLGSVLGSVALFGGNVVSGIGTAITGAGHLAGGANPGAGDLPIAIGSGISDIGNNIIGGANNLLDAAGDALADAWNDEPTLF